MQTTNGTTSNGAQARSGLAGQPTTYINGANTATPVVNNNNSNTMRVAHHNAYAPRRPQAQRSFSVQHQMPNTNGITYEMTVRGNSGAPMPATQSQAQVVQQAPQAHQWLPGHQASNANGWNPQSATNNNNAAGYGRYQFVWSVEPHSCQPQHPQQYQSHQQYQTPQPHQTPPPCQTPQPCPQPCQTPQHYQTQPYHRNQNLQQYHPQQHQPQQYQPQQYQNPAADSVVYANPSGDNVSLVDSARLSTDQTSGPASHTTPDAATVHAVNAPGVGAADAVQPSTNTEGPEDFQDRVNALVEENGATFGGHIRSAEDYQRYKLAVWKAKRSGGSYGNKAQDYPKDQAGQMRVRKQIFDAFVNLSGEQDSVSETDFNNCLAVRTVRGLSPLEVELVVQQFMEAMLKVQSGEPVTAPDFKVVQTPTFTAKVNEVVAALKRNKLLCRSALMSDDSLARIAADPVGERRKKTANMKNNSGKSKVLAAENLKKGTTRKPKGKGKRSAAEAEAEPQNEAGAQVDEVGRPTKRQRTTEQPPQVHQTQGQSIQPEQVSPFQLSEAGPTNGHLNNAVHTTPSVANPNQGDQSHLGCINQIPQTNTSASNELSHVLSEQNHQATNFANNSATTSQIDGASSQTPAAAVDQNQNPLGGAIQTHAELELGNGWENFDFGNESFENTYYDWTLDPAVSFTMDDAYEFQGLEQPTIQESHSSQVTQQEQAGQQQSDQGDAVQQDLNDSFFGEDAQFAAGMQALIDWNAQN